METKTIGILYEHPEWFVPLFAELDRRGLPYERIPAEAYAFDPSATSAPYALVVNRVSPSSYLRDHTSAIFQTQSYLAWLEAIGVPIINGAGPFALETSKARQLTLLAQLGIPHPRSRAVNHVSQIAAAASALEYPIIVKPNIGGSGVGLDLGFSWSNPTITVGASLQNALNTFKWDTTALRTKHVRMFFDGTKPTNSVWDSASCTRRVLVLSAVPGEMDRLITEASVRAQDTVVIDGRSAGPGARSARDRR